MSVFFPPHFCLSSSSSYSARECRERSKGTPRVHGEHPTPPPTTTRWCYESIVTNEKWWLDARLLQRRRTSSKPAGPHRDWNFEVVSEARVPIGGDLVREIYTGDINVMGSMQSVFWQILPARCTSRDVSRKWIKVSLMSAKSVFHVTRSLFSHFSHQSMSLPADGKTKKSNHVH